MKFLHDMYYLVRDGVQRLPMQYVRTVSEGHLDSQEAIDWTLAEARRLDAYGLAIDIEVTYPPAVARFEALYGPLAHSWDKRLQYILQDMSLEWVNTLKENDNNARVGMWSSFIQLADDAALQRWDNLSPGLSRSIDFVAFDCYLDGYHGTTDFEHWRVRFDTLLRHARSFIRSEIQVWINPKYLDGAHEGEIIPVDVLLPIVQICQDRGIDTVCWWYGSETSTDPVDLTEDWPILQLYEEFAG